MLPLKKNNKQDLKCVAGEMIKYIFQFLSSLKCHEPIPYRKWGQITWLILEFGGRFIWGLENLMNIYMKVGFPLNLLFLKCDWGGHDRAQVLCHFSILL